MLEFQKLKHCDEKINILLLNIYIYTCHKKKTHESHETRKLSNIILGRLWLS